MRTFIGRPLRTPARNRHLATVASVTSSKARIFLSTTVVLTTLTHHIHLTLRPRTMLQGATETFPAIGVKCRSEKRTGRRHPHVRGRRLLG